MEPDFSILAETLETLADSCEQLLSLMATEHADDPKFQKEVAIYQAVAASSRRAALWSRQMVARETRTH